MGSIDSINFKSLRIPKIYDTYADILCSVGIADLIEEISIENNSIVTIQDQSSYFQINFEEIQDLENITRISPGYIFIKRKRDTEPIPIEANVIDYEYQKEILKRKKESAKIKKSIKKKKTTQNKIIENPSEDEELNKEYNNIRNLELLRNNWAGDIDLFRYIESHQDEIKLLAKNYIDFMKSDDFFSILQYDQNQKLLDVVNNSQFFNPITGKGISSSKAKFKSATSFPNIFRIGFFEWMKFRGFFICGLSQADSDFTNIRISIIKPLDIPLNAIRKIRQNLINKYYPGFIKHDIFLLQEIVKELIKNSREYNPTESDPLLDFGGKLPNQIISGLSQASFVSLGNAYGINNISFLGLPGWFPIYNLTDATDMLEILEEHQKMISISFDESHSDDIEKIIAYRNFISSGNLQNFFEFTSKFACVLLNKIENGKVSLLTILNLTRLFKNMALNNINLSEIVENEGFLNIAKAIRISTVNAQYRKAQNNSVWDINYGLAQQWKKHAPNKVKFMIELGEFVQQYNAETARHAEQNKPEKREAIKTEDLDQILGFIEKYGSELIANLLLAYGFARDPKIA